MTKPRAYFAFRSPYSRLGLYKLKPVAHQVDLLAFTGPPEGNDFQDPTQNAAKIAYVVQDVARLTAHAALPLAMPNPFDIDFAPALRAFVAADQEGKGFDFALAVSDARWGLGRDASDLSVLEECAAQCGCDAAIVLESQDDPAIAKIIDQYRDFIELDQVFGVPFIAWGDKKYWGQDRFDLFLEEFGSKAD